MASEQIWLANGDSLPSGRAAGIMIALGSIFSVIFMAFHPTVQTRGLAEFVAEVSRQALVNGIVHGSLIALLGVLLCGFTCLASRLGMNSIWVRAGLVAYAMGTVAMAAAASVNGFILPEFVARYHDRPGEELETMRQILALCRAANQVASKMGVVGASAAIVLWSIALARHRRPSRAIGALGCAAGALLILALLSGYLPMNVHGTLAFIVTQGVWSLAVAAQLIRNRI